MGNLGSNYHEIVELSTRQRESRAASKITLMDFSEATSRVLCPLLVSSGETWRDMEHLQERARKMLKGQEHPSYKDRLREFGLFSLEKIQLIGDLINVYKYLKGGCQEDGTRLFLVVPRNGTRGNGPTLIHRKFHLYVRKNFTIR